MISAHLDHIGVNEALTGDKIFNGADDDASGSVAVMELARVLASGKSGYLFDERGNLIGWALDTGDDNYLRVAVDQSARKGSLSTGQIIVGPPADVKK